MKRFVHFLLRVSPVAVALLLCSCRTPDPKYSANVSRIPDINYSPDKIVGTWADVYISLVQSQTVGSEGKVYYEFRPGGRGLMRQASRNTTTGASLSIEGDFTWKYLGANRWVLNMPPSSEYRVTSSNNLVMGYRPAVAIYVRYFENELYVTPGGSVWVRATRERVTELARRVRSSPPVYIGNRQ